MSRRDEKALMGERTAVRLITGALAALAIVSMVAAPGACKPQKDVDPASNCDPAIDPDCEVDAGMVPTDGGGQTAILTFGYVLIRDLEPSNTDGMELDGVALIKGGSTFYADEFHEYIQGEGISHVTTTREPNQALGPPNRDGGHCPNGDTSYVNLGGTGGSIIVTFGGRREIAAGDRLRVYGCGSYSVLVGIGFRAADPNWVTCAAIASGVSECTVPIVATTAQ